MITLLANSYTNIDYVGDGKTAFYNCDLKDNIKNLLRDFDPNSEYNIICPLFDNDVMIQQQKPTGELVKEIPFVISDLTLSLVE